MNNKRNISFSNSATVLIITIMVMMSCSGLIAATDNEVNISETTMALEMNSISIIPNCSFDYNLLIDSSIKEAFEGVLTNDFTQKPVGSRTTITSHNTAIFLEFNCPDRSSQTFLILEPTIFPIPIFKLIPTYVGTDFHEIEFSLHATFNKLNDSCCAGLGFDFSGRTKKTIGTLATVIV